MAHSEVKLGEPPAVSQSEKPIRSAISSAVWREPRVPYCYGPVPGQGSGAVAADPTVTAAAQAGHHDHCPHAAKTDPKN